MKDFDCMHFACFSFTFRIYIEKDIRRTWSKPPYVGLHFDQQPRESVCLKNGGNQYNIAEKVFVVYQKRNYGVSLIL